MEVRNSVIIWPLSNTCLREQKWWLYDVSVRKRVGGPAWTAPLCSSRVNMPFHARASAVAPH
eukprot:2588837-Karenia_brevis.AAC.1